MASLLAETFSRSDADDVSNAYVINQSEESFPILPARNYFRCERKIMNEVYCPENMTIKHSYGNITKTWVIYEHDTISVVKINTDLSS